MKKIRIPARRIDAPWRISQDECISERGTLEELKNDIEIWHNNWQYVSEEILFPTTSWDFRTLFSTLKKPVCPGTTTGTVYLSRKENLAVQIFVISDEPGNIHFTPIGNPEIFVKHGTFINITGQLELKWNAYPGYCFVTLNYEYDNSARDCWRME